MIVVGTYKAQPNESFEYLFHEENEGLNIFAELFLWKGKVQLRRAGADL